MPRTPGPMTLLARSRKARWWATVLLIGVPVLYVLSFGPVCWTLSRAGVEGRTRLSAVYQPLLRASVTAPRPVGQLIAWYSQVWAADGWGWHHGYPTGDKRIDAFDWSGHSYPPGKARFPWPSR